MKRFIGWGLAALVIVLAGLGGWWWKKHGAADAPAAVAAPVATVKSELPKVQSVPEILNAVGDVRNPALCDGLALEARPTDA